MMEGNVAVNEKETDRGKIAVLGWGSLLWDDGDERRPFLEQIGNWRSDGPELPLEFSRVSTSRKGALTLVIDTERGLPCRVSYSISQRHKIEDVVEDLRAREGNPPARRIGKLLLGEDAEGDSTATAAIHKWAEGKELAGVVWTALVSNFREKAEKEFSVANAIAYLNALEPRIRLGATEYICRAPEFISTPLRTALVKEPWFNLLAEQVKRSLYEGNSRTTPDS